MKNKGKKTKKKIRRQKIREYTAKANISQIVGKKRKRKKPIVKASTVEQKEKSRRQYLNETADFNSIGRIRKAINKNNIDDFNDILKKRKDYYLQNNIKLNKFVLFGWLVLGEEGEISIISATMAENTSSLNYYFIKYKNIVENFKRIEDENNVGILIETPIEITKYYLPKSGEKCSICNKEFTVRDLMEEPIVKTDEGMYHSQCYRENEQNIFKDRDKKKKELERISRKKKKQAEKELRKTLKSIIKELNKLDY